MNQSNLEFYNNIFLYLIPIIQAIILLVPFLGSGALYDRRKKPLSRFSKRGYTLLVLALILIIVSIKQSQVTNDLNKLSIASAEIKMAKRDSINQSKDDMDRLKTTEMLARYGLKVDTQNNEIVKILKDPTSRKITNNYGEDPVLDLSEAKVDGKKIFLKFTSYQATSYDINVKIDILGDVNNKTIMLVRDRFVIAENAIIIKNKSLENNWTIDHFIIPSISRFYFKLHGSYKKSNGTKIPIENYYALDKDNGNQIGSPVPAILFLIREAYKDEHYK